MKGEAMKGEAIHVALSRMHPPDLTEQNGTPSAQTRQVEGVQTRSTVAALTRMRPLDLRSPINSLSLIDRSLIAPIAVAPAALTRKAPPDSTNRSDRTPIVPIAVPLADRSQPPNLKSLSGDNPPMAIVPEPIPEPIPDKLLLRHHPLQRLILLKIQI